MKKEMCIESASRDKERMLKYKEFSVAFSYPDSKFFDFFPDFAFEKEKLISEYDRLFRAKEIWLYTVEYLAKNEFQRANYLADIMGFYRAFGVEPDKDRPDSVSGELEFMHLLIFKFIHANKKDTKGAKEKADTCLSAQKIFFTEHLYPAAKKIIELILAQSERNFYSGTASRMLKFLESEKRFLEDYVG